MADISTSSGIQEDTQAKNSPTESSPTNSGSAVGNFFKGMTTNTGVIGEVMVFLWQRKLWWLIPMVTVLLLFGLLLVFASSSGVAPFIYTLF
jgi:hypothetical protein